MNKKQYVNNLTDEQILDIRINYIPSKAGNFKELKNKYNLTRIQLQNIIYNHTRKELPKTSEINIYMIRQIDYKPYNGSMDRERHLEQKDIDEIRIRYSFYRLNVTQISKEYNLPPTLISRIISGDNLIGRITPTLVFRIREMYSTGNYTHKSLAKTLQVSQSKIKNIVQRSTWRHVL